MARRLICLMGWMIVVGVSAALAAETHFEVVKKIRVPGEGGWDYLALDTPARRLYVTHSVKVDVVNVDKSKVVGEIPDTPGPHGVALAPELGRGFVSNGRDGSVTIFELKTLKPLGRVAVDGQNPDTIVYDPATQRVFTFNGKSSDATALDAATGKIIGHVALGGRPEFAVADGSGTIFDDLEDRSELLAIDSKALKVKNRWPVAPCEEPSTIAIDKSHRRLFIGCGNQQMAVVDADSGKVITMVPIGDHVDATVFDPELGLIFNSCGEGVLTVVHQDSPDAYHVVENVKTEMGARTVALDEKTHRLYLANAEFGRGPATPGDAPRPHPTVKPKSFHILVIAPAK